MDIDFEVDGQIVKRKDRNVIVNKSRNYLYTNFTFKTSEWEGVDKYAIFKDGWGNPYHVHLGTEDTFRCPPPNEVLEGISFKVTVYGGELITTNEVNVILIPSGYTVEYVPSSEDKNKNIFFEIFEKLNSKIEEIRLENDFINCYINGEKVCSIPLNATELSDVATTGDYNDLKNIPNEFTPKPHNHITEDIVDYEENIDYDLGVLLDSLSDEISKE